MPGEGKSYQYMPPGRSIVTVLAGQHIQLVRLAGELARSSAPSRNQADRLTAALTRHLSAEQQYLYPAAAAVAATTPSDEIEHGRSMLGALVSLRKAQPGSQAFIGAVDAVEAGLRHHVHMCETVIFPALAGAVSKADLVRLGNRAEIAHEAAPSRPRPRALMRPPWNKLTDAAVGAIDKILDLAGGRKTYPDASRKPAGTKALAK